MVLEAASSADAGGGATYFDVSALQGDAITKKLPMSSGTLTTVSLETASVSKGIDAPESTLATEGTLHIGKSGLPKAVSIISDEEYDKLRKQQAQMAAKMLAGELSAREILQLKMIRWAINRGEEARLGAGFGNLEVLTSLHEKLAGEIDRMMAAFNK